MMYRNYDTVKLLLLNNLDEPQHVTEKRISIMCRAVVIIVEKMTAAGKDILKNKLKFIVDESSR